MQFRMLHTVYCHLPMKQDRTMLSEFLVKSIRILTVEVSVYTV